MYEYEEPTTTPTESVHWQSLHHVKNDVLLYTMEDLVQVFQVDLLNAKDDDNGGIISAVWSCLFGYCEALSTNSTVRYAIFPIPIDALRRLIQTEFIPQFVQQQPLPPDDTVSTKATTDNSNQQQQSSLHRKAARNVANCIWKSVVSKKNIKDEVHANSLYIWLRGASVCQPKKSMDCFGVALCTVVGLRCMGFESSTLTLSEDHAYITYNGETCEVAVAGKTLNDQHKRARSIHDTFTSSSTITPETSWLYMYTAPIYCTSTATMISAALANVNCTIGDTQKKQKNNGRTKLSASLMDIKRTLLWICKDHGCMDKFPYGLLELGDCEEHRPSQRGMKWVILKQGEAESRALAMEALYHKAIFISKHYYQDKQVYPYCYLGNYHKDAGKGEEVDSRPVGAQLASSSSSHSSTAISIPLKDGPLSSLSFCETKSVTSTRITNKDAIITSSVTEVNAEYRFVEAIRCYSEASRVASQYKYEWTDSLQLTKVMIKLANFIHGEIFLNRVWYSTQNLVAAGTWLYAFYDYLLYWEEHSGKRFLSSIITSTTTSTPKQTNVGSIAKTFNLLSLDIRVQVLEKIIMQSPITNTTQQQEMTSNTTSSSSSHPSQHQQKQATQAYLEQPKITTKDRLQYYAEKPKSERFAIHGSLWNALKERTKFTIQDIELELILLRDTTGRSKRIRKKRKQLN